MQRHLQPEILDSLPPHHPDALHNRRDLRIINFIMGNDRWFARELPRRVKSGEGVLELGCGLGELAARLESLGLAINGLDLWPQPEGWSDDRKWHDDNLLFFDGYPAYPVVIGNMILHQFSDTELRGLGSKLRRSARALLFCEPARQRRSQVLFAGFGRLIGANHVSLHDARVSIAAGFLGTELPEALELDPREWDCRCVTTLLGAYRMIALRR